MSRTQTFVIPGRLPGLNEIVAAAKGCKGRGIMYSRMKADLNAALSALARKSLVPVGPASFQFHWVEANKKRDPDNLIAAKKFVFDGLVEAGIMPNDGWAEILATSDTWEAQRDDPRIIVTITEP